MPAWEWEAGWWVCAMPHMIKCRCFVVHAYTLPSDQKSMSTRYGVLDLDTALCPLRTVRDSRLRLRRYRLCAMYVSIYRLSWTLKNSPFGAVSAFASAALFWYNTQLRVQRVGTGTPGQRELHKFTTRRAFVNALVIKAWDTQVKTCTPGGQRRPWKVQGILV